MFERSINYAHEALENADTRTADKRQAAKILAECAGKTVKRREPVHSYDLITSLLSRKKEKPSATIPAPDLSKLPARSVKAYEAIANAGITGISPSNLVALCGASSIITFMKDLKGLVYRHDSGRGNSLNRVKIKLIQFKGVKAS